MQSLFYLQDLNYYEIRLNTLEIHIARGTAKCNMNFQSSNKFYIAHHSAIFTSVVNYVGRNLTIVIS